MSCQLRYNAGMHATSRTERDSLVLDNLNLARHIAHKVYRARQRRQKEPAAVPLEDILQAGMLGLVKASHGFDPGRGFKFASYAWPAVLHSILGMCDATEKVTRDQWTGYDGAGRGEDTFHLGMVPDENTGAAIDAIDLGDEIAPLLAVLPKRLRRLVVLRFGLDGRGERTLTEIGREMGGITKERARQMLGKALERMRRETGMIAVSSGLCMAK